MSWANIRPYFNGILDGQGYEEHTDGFSYENIPLNLLDKSFHITLGPGTGQGQSHTDQETSFLVTVRTFYKGYAYPQEAIDTAVAETQAIMQGCVNLKSRTTTPGLLNVVFDRVEIEPIGETNDNAVMATSEYTVRVLVAVC